MELKVGHMKEEWKSVSIIIGALSVMISGTAKMQQLSATSWGIQVCNYIYCPLMLSGERVHYTYH